MSRTQVAKVTSNESTLRLTCLRHIHGEPTHTSGSRNPWKQGTTINRLLRHFVPFNAGGVSYLFSPVIIKFVFTTVRKKHNAHSIITHRKEQ